MKFQTMYFIKKDFQVVGMAYGASVWRTHDSIICSLISEKALAKRTADAKN